MTHMEKYSENIAKIACSGELFGVIRGDDKPVSCRGAICQNCLFYNARPDPDDWCSQENAASGLILNADTKIRRILMENVIVNKEVDDNKVNEERESPEITGNLRQISSVVNPVKELIPNHIYQFKRPFDAYFCMDGRVQVKHGAICECKKTDSVSTTLYFFGSNNNLPFEKFSRRILVTSVVS